MFALQLFALGGYFASFLFGVEYVEDVSGRRCAVQTQYQCRTCGAGFLDALVALVEHCFDPAEVVAGQDDVTYAKRSVLHQYGGYVTATFVEGRFDDAARGLAVRVGLKVKHLGLEKHFFHQFGYARTFLG